MSFDTQLKHFKVVSAEAMRAVDDLITDAVVPFSGVSGETEVEIDSRGFWVLTDGQTPDAADVDEVDDRWATDACERFMTEVNAEWGALSGKHGLGDTLFPAALMKCKPPSVVWYGTEEGPQYADCQYSVFLPVATVTGYARVRNARVGFRVSAASSAEDMQVIGVEYEWRPLAISPDDDDGLAVPDTAIVPVADDEEMPAAYPRRSTPARDYQGYIKWGDTLPVVYQIDLDKNEIRPWYMGFSVNYGGLIPAWDNADEPATWGEDAEDELSLDDFPNQARAVLYSLGFADEALELSSSELAELKSCLKFLILIEDLHLRGDYEVNGGEYQLYGHCTFQIQYSEPGDAELGVYHIELTSGTSLRFAVKQNLATGEVEAQLLFMVDGVYRLPADVVRTNAAVPLDIVPSTMDDDIQDDDLIFLYSLDQYGGHQLIKLEPGEIAEKDIPKAQKSAVKAGHWLGYGSEYKRKVEEHGVPWVEQHHAFSLAMHGSRLLSPSLLSQRIYTPSSMDLAIYSSGKYHKDSFKKNKLGKQVFDAGSWKSIQGALAEVAFNDRMNGVYRDLNEVIWYDMHGNVQIGNFPMFDAQHRITGNLVQIGTSTRRTFEKRREFWKSKALDITGHGDLGGRGILFSRAVTAALDDPAHSQMSTAELRRTALLNAQMAINPDDVEPFRDYMIDYMMKNGTSFDEWFDAQLSQSHVEVDGKPYYSLQKLIDGRKSGDWGDVTNSWAKYDAARLQVYERFRSQIVAHHPDLTTRELQNLKEARQVYPPGNQIAWEQHLTPVEVHRSRIGFAAALKAEGVASMKYGSGLSAGFYIASAGVTDEELSAQGLMIASAAGGIDAGVSTTVENLVARQLTRRGMMTALGRGFSEVAGSSVAAPITEVFVMGAEDILTDRDYTKKEYFVNSGRATVGAVVSGVATAALTAPVAATIASALGVAAIGTGGLAVIGVGIGLAAGLAFYALAGEDVELKLGEFYDSFDPPTEVLHGNWEVRDFGYFRISIDRIDASEDEDKVYVKRTGTYISRQNWVNNVEEIYAEVKQSKLEESEEPSARSAQIFANERSIYVPITMLKPTPFQPSSSETEELLLT